MNELIKSELSKNIGKKVLIFLLNDFRYEGVILDCDEEFVKINDLKTNSQQIISINKINQIEVKNGH